MVARVYNHTSAPVNAAGFLDQAEPDFGHWDILRKMFDGYFVVNGCGVTAQVVPDQTVAVAAGVASVGDNLVTVGAGNVSLSAADATNARFDLITVDTSAVKGVVDGTAHANPCLPSYPANKTVIAVIYRPANDNTITNDLIESCSSAPRMLRHKASNVVAFHYDSDANGSALEFKNMTAPAAGSGNTLRLYTKAFGNTVAAFLRDSVGADYGPLGDKAQATFAGRGPSGGMEPPLSTTWSDGVWGTLAPAASWTTYGAAAPTVANDSAVRRGRYMQAQTGATSGDDAGIESTAVFWAQMESSYLIRFFLPDITSVRFFAGVAAQTLPTMVGSDAMGTNHLGLQFSTPRADTNWQFTERGTGGQTLTNTGVAASATEPFYIQIVTGTNTQMALFNSSFIPVATRTVGFLTKPGGNTLVSIIVGCETQTAAARSVRWFHINEHSRTS